MRVRRLDLHTVLALLGLVLACAGCERHRRPDANVILISLDTLRADHLSVYGHPRPTSPHLEAFAEEAIVFERFYNNGGGTLPSHITMLTSLTPGVHGIVPGRGALEEERVTLAETLRAAGRATAAFTDAGWMRAEFGFAQGFDHFDEEGGHLAAILPKARRWIDDHRDRPFFLFLHTYDVHSESERLPYDCPAPYVDLYVDELETGFDGCRDGKCASELLASLNARIRQGRLRPAEAFTADELAYIVALYDGCINYVDHELSRFFDHLRASNLYDDALIVVTSDHGEEFFEHGLLLHEQGGYEELSRIPLLVKLPGGAFGGRRISHLGAMVDLMPTVLDVVGETVPEDAQGESLMPAVIRGEPVRDVVYMAEIVRDDRWMYMNLPDGRRELYDRRTDPREQHNVVDMYDEIAGRLDRELWRLKRSDVKQRRDFLKSVGNRRRDIELDPEKIEELKALGYLQ